MANIDNREIYVAYSIGESLSNGKVNFTEPHIVYAQVGEPVSFETIESIGRIPDYDRTIVLDVGENTQYISEDSVLWIDSLPNEAKDNYDYVIARLATVGEGPNQKLKLYCNEVAPNTQFIYYSNDGENIYQLKVFYNAFTAVVPKNVYFPITQSSLVWYLRPSGIDSARGKIKLVDKIEHLKTFMYVFEEA